VRRNGGKNKVKEIKGGVSAIKRGEEIEGKSTKKETDRTEINKVLK
jgi:hypothetical protein